MLQIPVRINHWNNYWCSFNRSNTHYKRLYEGSTIKCVDMVQKSNLKMVSRLAALTPKYDTVFTTKIRWSNKAFLFKNKYILWHCTWQMFAAHSFHVMYTSSTELKITQLTKGTDIIRRWKHCKWVACRLEIHLRNNHFLNSAFKLNNIVSGARSR